MARRRPNTPAVDHDPVDHGRQIPRLRRIEGQIRGLQKMIHEGRHCLEIVNQAGAVVSSIRRVQGDMLRDHLAASSKLAIAGKLPEAECRQLADEIAKMIKGLV
jgi:CsoR family transcriptional regulator, copper-sensing transcriptional repressor